MTSIQQQLQNLMHIVPGYVGYQAKEQRRDADKALRIHLAHQYRNEQRSLQQLAQQVVARGCIDYADDIEGINQTLNFFIARLENAPRGYSGWFDAIQITETDLDRLYEFDAKLADNIPLMREQIEFAMTTLAANEGFDNALAALRDFTDTLNSQLNDRQAFVSLGKRPRTLTDISI